MKKIFAFTLALLMLMGTFAHAEEAKLLYQSDFTSSADGWYARSMGTAQVETTADGALKITGRTDNWNSPGRDFELETGVPYEFSVEVRQSTTALGKFMVSVAHTKDGVESYENLAFGNAPKDEWITVSGKYTAGDYTKFVLYVETTGAPELDFEIRNFILKGKQLAVEKNADLPSLKEIYAGRFDFGTAVTGMETRNTRLMDFYATQFNIMTPGNEMKPDSMLDVTLSKIRSIKDDTAVAVSFNAVKPLLDYAKKHGIKVHGHVLVWHNQTPEAFFHEHYNTSLPLLTREALLARFDNYVREIMTYLDKNYPGVVVSWDVVNEAIDDNTGKLRDSKWLTIVGEDYVERTFEIARKHAPEGVLLFYNDYNTAILGKQNGIVALLERLMAEGTVDGYGFQMHHDIKFPSIAQIEYSVKRIADMGLLLRVSELDVTIPDTSEASLKRQAQMYADIMELLEPYEDQLLAVQVWGVTDDLSWRASQFPLLFDGESNPKSAFWAIVEEAGD